MRNLVDVINSERRIKVLRQMFLQYHEDTLAFEAFLRSKFGEEKYMNLCKEYASKRIKFEMSNWEKKEA